MPFVFRLYCIFGDATTSVAVRASKRERMESRMVVDRNQEFVVPMQIAIYVQSETQQRCTERNSESHCKQR